MQPYRNDLDALEARHAALAAEVADRTRARDEAARMLVEARARQRDEQIAADYAAGGLERRRRRAALVAFGALGLALGVIGFATAHGRRSDRDVMLAGAMAQFEAFADSACACKDSACVERLNDKVSAWANDLAKRFPNTDKLDPKWAKQAQAIAERMATCMTKAMDVPAHHAYRSQEGQAERTDLER
jgi:hypothetical protein